MAFAIRPFNKSLSDYEVLARIHNAAWGEAWLNADTRMLHDAKRDPTFFFRRFVAEIDGQLIAHATCGENAWNHIPGKYNLDIIVHPDWQQQGIGNALYQTLLSTLVDRTPAPTILTATTREDQTGAQAMLRQKGFAQVMRSPSSRLAVQTFDAAHFAKADARAQQAGVTLHAIRDLKEQDPNWKRRWYDLELAINADHPMPDHGEPLPYDTFAGFLETPLVNLDSAFFAVDGAGNYVGQSTLEVLNPGSDTVSVGMTGVLREWRRKGIATALKLRTIAYAQREGIKWIRTSNEERNPMFQLNLLLGFQPAPAWLNFEKRLER